MAGGVAQSPVIYPQQGGGIQHRRNAQDESSKIFVGGVGKNTTDATLQTYFSKFGEIADSVIMQDRETGESRGFAFVTFTSPAAVQKVVDQCNSGGHTLDGKVIDPKPAVPQGPNQQSRLATMKTHHNIQTQQGGGPQYKGPMQVSEELKIFVGGIGIGTTEEDIKNYFQTFGEVVAVDMPYHKIYNCPKGFAFVGFTSIEVVQSIVKDRYHQVNGKTVEVKGADEQRAHLAKKRSEGFAAHASRYTPRHAHAQPGTISTIGGVGAYAQLAAARPQQQQQVLIPQVINGQTQYVAAQIPAPAAAPTPQYVYDPSTNTYYQLPAASPVLGAAPGGAAGYPYGGGIQLIANPALAAAPASGVAQGQAGEAGAVHGIPGADGQLGAIYSNETSTFGPSRHALGQGGADSQVVYSQAAPLSTGETVSSRGFHPYGR